MSIHTHTTTHTPEPVPIAEPDDAPTTRWNANGDDEQYDELN